MKKVLFAATVVKTHINTFHIPFLKMFKEQGWETSVAARNDFPAGEECVIPYCDKYYDMKFERFPFKPANFRVYKELKKLIESEHYDIIHCHTPVGGVIARLAARKARKNGTRVIYTAHGFHFFKGAPIINWLIYYPVEKICARFTDCIITINKEDYERAKRFKAKRVEYVPGVGIDTNIVQNIPVNSNELEKEFSILANNCVLLSVGELIKRKNHETVIRAIAKCEDRNLRYIICGSGDLEQYLKKLCIDLGIQNKVRFAGFRKDIYQILKIADIFVFSSFQEGLPVALMEAMASGLPVICSDIRGNTDLIDEGKGGYLVDPKDVIGFAKAINNLILNKEEQLHMREYNLEKIKGYDSDIIMTKMKKIYETI